MGVFGAYAAYYDLLYADKDYSSEAQYVDDLIQRHVPGARSILELGCGTGLHAGLLVKKGYRVDGVDLSENMLARARTLRAALPTDEAARLHFSVGDLRTVRLAEQFDVVLSLFDVVSYQTRNDDLKATFETARAHLHKSGAFIFDCWYGPAVLHLLPEVRVKRVENEEMALTRIAEPVLRPNENRVDVNYHLLARHKNSGHVDELSECHSMRYLFAPEVQAYLAQSGMELVGSFPTMRDGEPGLETWSVCFVGRPA